ncbi:uncharacterized protein LOC128920127 [Zeugodacus cucurbitae]|uniref:uncharacterized protein LOC128920127 n=1 Tax=Zeugodacus cucurbitae TaxID=28588 RepID=UPI0023D8E2B5|nr:uncharacterized protein LOC128920127 [Zeugodacus cucurbitae]
MEVVFTVSNKGSNKIVLDGFDYHFRSKNEKKKKFRWSCAQRKSLICKSVVVTKENSGDHVIQRAPTAHNHDPKTHQVSVAQANNKVKDLSTSSSLAPSQIIREAVVDCQPDRRVYLPSKRGQKMKISRLRKGTYTNEPGNVQEINIPEHLKYLEGELFVLSDWDFDGEKNIIMGTTSSLKELERSHCWVMDGTFFVVPKVFRQLFTIQGLIDGQFVPLVLCLMSKKSKQAYTEFFHQLFKLGLAQNINLHPQRIITDFERTVSSAAKEYFPDARYNGCLFHFSQIIWRRV